MSTGSRLSRSAGTTPVRSPDNRHRLSDKRPPRNPKRYLSVFRIRFTSSLQYRTAALAGVATQFFWGFVLIMVYIALFVKRPGAADLPAAARYIRLAPAILSGIHHAVVPG